KRVGTPARKRLPLRQRHEPRSVPRGLQRGMHEQDAADAILDGREDRRRRLHTVKACLDGIGDLAVEVGEGFEIPLGMACRKARRFGAAGVDFTAAALQDPQRPAERRIGKELWTLLMPGKAALFAV